MWSVLLIAAVVEAGIIIAITFSMNTTAVGVVSNLWNPTIILASITLALAVAAFLNILATRRATEMNFLMIRLDRLYAPLHDEVIRRGEALDASWPAMGPPGSEQLPWFETVSPLMRDSGYLASAELHDLYQQITREERAMDSGKVKEEDRQAYYEQRSDLMEKFSTQTEADYRDIRSKLERLMP